MGTKIEIKEEDPLSEEIASQNDRDFFHKTDSDAVLLDGDHGVTVKTEIKSETPFLDFYPEREREHFIKQIKSETVAYSNNCEREFLAEDPVMKVNSDHEVEIKEEPWWLETATLSVCDNTKDGDFIPVKSQRYLATGLSFRSLAFSFRVGKSTVSVIVHETCQAIWDEFVQEFMPQPTEEQLQKVATEYYQRWNFPNCFGAIDGKHCQIKCPRNSGSSYYNYLRYFSIVLQGVADADKKFVTVEVGARGKQSDGGIFSASTLFNLLEANQFNVPSNQTLPNSNIQLPLVLIGDEAYPLKPYLMRPYPGRGLTPRRENFNKYLSRAPKCVECAFGILYAKWRFLSKDIETDVMKANGFIKCACVLHNIIRERDGDSDFHYREVMQQNVNEEAHLEAALNRRNNSSSALARQVREKFAEYFGELQNVASDNYVCTQ